MNRLVALVSFLCATWVLCYMLFSGIDPGRSMYARMADRVVGDPKGGGQILHLAFPVLIAGSLASLCWTLPSLSVSRRSALSSLVRQQLPNWIYRCRHRLLFVEGEWKLDFLAWTLILVPSVVFVFMVVYRHMHGKELALDDQVSVTSNAFGVVAEVVGSFLMIPVARHSSLLKVVGWSPARAVILHIWTGRIFILAVIVHGSMHMFRWVGLSNESLVGMLVPPAGCWSMNSETYNAAQPTCVDEDTDCTCYDIHRNLTGVLAGVALLVILITSWYPIRRQCYRLFYMSHVIAAPLAIILVVLHWNRSILFMAPSLIYYTASSFPVFVESWGRQSTSKGVEVVSIDRIASFADWKGKQGANSRGTNSTHYISLTVRATEAAVRQFRPGYYIQLLAPDVSTISHPFTINLVPARHDQLRIIFKATGNFTLQLSQSLQPQQPPSSSLPPIFLDGFLGSPSRVREVLQHDVATMVAGGIGITPYLTLLHHVHDLLAQAPLNTFATKRIVLLWICRDASLVEYVQREYFQPMLTSHSHNDNADFKIKIVVYHTGDHSMTAMPCSNDEENALPASPVTGINTEAASLIQGRPFSPSRFSTGSSSSMRTNILCFLAFSFTAWLGLASVWWAYKHLQAKKETAYRVTGPVFIVVVGLVVAVAVNILSGLSCFQQDGEDSSTSSPMWSPVPSLDEEAALPDGLVQSSIEMETVGAVPDVNEGDMSDDDIDGAVSENVVSLEERRGRPSVHQLLKYADKGRHPGLFTCGPLPLMKDIREHTEERCIMRLQQCMRGASHNIALYEEAFAM
ncbi:NADPH oxidase 4 [Seminavis robusta]|uniref:NADPH oxidase 4 n=1 Tax=Seminavis robusta TaxID=568900 RepID=A0A9N8EUY3_9STRA|nr:NADPH oxidase 4 [Seminavis robusta]|eukprot:Sro1838_g300770.1 NADPH oxidase 4 (800) ;mRNA; f:106-2505